jgi:hypothetical protein
MTTRRTHNPNKVVTTPFHPEAHKNAPNVPPVWPVLDPPVEFVTCGQCTVLMVKGDDVGGLCPDCDCLWRTGQLCPN